MTTSIKVWSSSPKYKHDCTNCVFLDSVYAGNNTDVDLYICYKSNSIDIILRYSSEPADYSSWGLSTGIKIAMGSTNVSTAKLVSTAIKLACQTHIIDDTDIVESLMTALE